MMNKKEFVEVLAKKMDTTVKEATEITDMFLDTIAKSIIAGGVKFVGFGSFEVVDVAEKTGTIQMGDKKGQEYTTPAHKKPKFKAGSVLKNAVKGE